MPLTYPYSTLRCEIFYKRLLDTFVGPTGTNRSQDMIFSIGYMAGEVEKIYLGACKGAMFCPPPYDTSWLFDAAKKIARIYSLYARALTFGIREEIWILKDPNIALALKAALAYSDKEFNRLRGQICGIPDEFIDLEFDWEGNS